MSPFYLCGILLSWIILTQVLYAVPQIEYSAPSSIVTTVGELTIVQLNIRNIGVSKEYYHIKISAAMPNEMEITNSDITTQFVNPGDSISVYTNIRTLTENNNPLTIRIERDNNPADFKNIPAIPVQSKKFSLPEFELAGFLQIIAIAAVIYFLFSDKMSGVVKRGNNSKEIQIMKYEHISKQKKFNSNLHY